MTSFLFNKVKVKTQASVQNIIILHVFCSEVWARGKGYGKEALCTMMKYGKYFFLSPSKSQHLIDN